MELTVLQQFIIFLILIFDVNWIVDRICKCVEHGHVADTFSKVNNKEEYK